jgi:hypothetical protein
MILLSQLDARGLLKGLLGLGRVPQSEIQFGQVGRASTRTRGGASVCLARPLTSSRRPAASSPRASASRAALLITRSNPVVEVASPASLSPRVLRCAEHRRASGQVAGASARKVGLRGGPERRPCKGHGAGWPTKTTTRHRSPSGCERGCDREHDRHR